MNDKLISTLVQSQIPRYIRENNKKFGKFLEYYYEWVEQPGEFYHLLADSIYYADFDLTTDEFVELFSNTFLSNVPKNIRYKLFMRYANEFYRAKGTEPAYKLLFSLLTGDNVELYYPNNDILNISDGRWKVDKTIKTTSTNPNDIASLIGLVIEGKESKAKALIDSAIKYTADDGTYVAELSLIQFDLNYPIDSFIIGEQIIGDNDKGKEVIETVYGLVTEVSLDTNVSNYASTDHIDIVPNGSGTDAGFYIRDITYGPVTHFIIIDGGIDYEVGDVLLFDDLDSGGEGVYATVKSVDGSGTITSIFLETGGQLYSSVPIVIHVSSTSGTGAIIYAEGTHIGNIKSIASRDFGVDYDNIPTANFPIIFRIKDLIGNFDQGETITGSISEATAIVNSYDFERNILRLNVISGTFDIADELSGDRSFSTANIVYFNNATGSCNIGTYAYYDGKYTSSHGHLSSDKYIQDSYFFQKFSYQLRKVITPEEEWIDVAYNLCHPSGMNMLTEFDATISSLPTSYGGFSLAAIEELEYYKFRMPTTQSYNGDGFGNSQIKDFLHIDIASFINTYLGLQEYKREKIYFESNAYKFSRFCIGSTITLGAI